MSENKVHVWLRIFEDDEEPFDMGDEYGLFPIDDVIDELSRIRDEWQGTNCATRLSHKDWFTEEIAHRPVEA